MTYRPDIPLSKMTNPEIVYLFLRLGALEMFKARAYKRIAELKAEMAAKPDQEKSILELNIEAGDDLGKRNEVFFESLRRSVERGRTEVDEEQK